MFVNINHTDRFHYVESKSSVTTVCGQSLSDERYVVEYTPWEVHEVLTEAGLMFLGMRVCGICTRQLPIDVRGMVK